MCYCSLRGPCNYYYHSTARHSFNSSWSRGYQAGKTHYPIIEIASKDRTQDLLYVNIEPQNPHQGTDTQRCPYHQVIYLPATAIQPLQFSRTQNLLYVNIEPLSHRTLIKRQIHNVALSLRLSIYQSPPFSLCNFLESAKHLSTSSIKLRFTIHRCKSVVSASLLGIMICVRSCE